MATFLVLDILCDEDADVKRAVARLVQELKILEYKELIHNNALFLNKILSLSQMYGLPTNRGLSTET